MEESKNIFDIIESTDGKLKSLGYKSDPYKMNWIKGEKEWGTVIKPDTLDVTITRKITETGNLEECYCFKNTSDFPVFLQKRDIGIYLTFNDDYESAEICMKNRCHTHISCNGNSSYVMALRMGGEGKNLGLVTTEGGFSGYSVERRTKEGGWLDVVSNDRGDFIFHPDIEEMNPGEEAVIRWELFWFDDREDFQNRIVESVNTPILLADQCTYFKGEEIKFTVKCGEQVPESEIKVVCNGQQIPFSYDWKETYGTLQCKYRAEKEGECTVEVKIGVHRVTALFYICGEFEKLVRNRCRFIAQKQQYHGKAKTLEGAYLIYDNQDERIYYSHRDDHNGGRERVGMGALMALYLQKEKDEELLKSLDEYIQYVYRELYDKSTGIVCNDISRNLDWHRMYNYMWMVVFLMEVYHLTHQKTYLQDAYQTAKRYYLEGGETFYAIGTPVEELVQDLRSEKFDSEADDITERFLKHADFIAKTGKSYPPSEVTYEQSIVAPAVSCLIQAYNLTGNDKYLNAATEQMEILYLFNGRQPDYHLFENAIRHWDGYWFGKARMLGDTFPHYWSVLTGIAMIEYDKAKKTDFYEEIAKASLRGCLNLFTMDGKASCAMVFPESVNGEKAHFYDEWANDQDWALYYALKYQDILKK